MPNEFIKAEKVVSAQLGILEREVVLPNLVWRDAAGDFRGAKNDTISIRLPAYANARTRALRSGAARTQDTLHQRKVDVSLTTDIYSDIPVTDEELTLDITNFGEEIINPVLAGVVRAYEDILVDRMESPSTTYQHAVAFNASNPHETLVSARRKLNDSNVPQSGRSLVIGTGLEQAILNAEEFVRVDQSGSDSALRDAVIGRIAGFNVIVSNALAPYVGFAFHRTAFVLSSRAPIVPAGAPWGTTMSSGGFAIRTVRVFDPDEVEDRLITDAWVGTNIVQDHGTIDGFGKFVPSVDPDLENGTDLMFVRAVKIGSATSS